MIKNLKFKKTKKKQKKNILVGFLGGFFWVGFFGWVYCQPWYKDIMRVLSLMPNLRMSVTTEVVDDEEQHVVTAGAIITVTILITRFSHFLFRQMQQSSVADPYPGSGMNFPVHSFESLETIFWVKNTSILRCGYTTLVTRYRYGTYLPHFTCNFFFQSVP